MLREPTVIQPAPMVRSHISVSGSARRCKKSIVRNAVRSNGCRSSSGGASSLSSGGVFGMGGDERICERHTILINRSVNREFL